MNISTVKVPKRISSSPIAEAIVELRFDSELPTEALIGLAISKLIEKYPNFEKLPIMQLPDFARDKDPSLKFSPHYRLANDDYIFQIGPHCFSISCHKEYQGWARYYEQIEFIFNEMEKLNIVKNHLRIGVRYINFFENINIFEKIKIALSLSGDSLICHRNFLRSEFDYKEYRCIIQLSNEAVLANKSNGSSIDIDVINESISTMKTSFQDIISNAHNIGKKLFFGILNDDFVQSFNPEY